MTEVLNAMTKIKFACSNCRLKEVIRTELLDKEANKGKKLFGKQKTKLNPDNFINEASEIIFLKDTQLERGKISNLGSTDPNYPTQEIQASVADGWRMKCSSCGEYTEFSRGLGNI